MSAIPFHQAQHVEISGNRIAFHRAGSGEPVVLVHGVTTASFIWRRVVPHLIPSFDVIAVDLLGFGDSDRPHSADLSVKAHAERIRQLITELGLRRVHLAGHDVGGAIAQIVAARYPDLLADTAWLNTVGYDYWPVQPITTLRTPIMRQLAMATLDHGVLRIIVRRGLFHKDRLDDELFEHFHQQVSADDARKTFLQFVRALNSRDVMDIVPQLRKLSLPVLIIRGDADVYLSEEISLRLQHDVPGSRLLRIPTAGHFIQEDEPEKVAEALIDFFREGAA